ncbi:class E sortase [bacterium]|nr:class E sortase [bacterium]
MLLLTTAPANPLLDIITNTSIDLDKSDDQSDNRDRIQIERIGLEVPLYEGGEDSLDKGVWHRWPERGNPEKGGNFILSAHRFKIGVTPVQTIINSPFYNVDKLRIGDTIRVFWDDEWYTYKISKTYTVLPNAIGIEAPSEEAKLTLYTCSLGGSADGRVVIEANLSDKI